MTEGRAGRQYLSIYASLGSILCRARLETDKPSTCHPRCLAEQEKMRRCRAIDSIVALEGAEGVDECRKRFARQAVDDGSGGRRRMSMH